MLSEPAAADPRGRVAGGRAFWWRLTDNLFRHAVWFLIPIVLFAAIGVDRARNTVGAYSSSGTLSASENPLVPTQTATGINAQFWETPAAATSRIINEQLRTDSFLTQIADKVGFGDAVESGFISLDTIRTNVWASANGDSILTVNARWGDSESAFRLAAATIAQYEAFLTETVTSNSSEAVSFYTEQLDDLVPQRDAADTALRDYVAGLPDLGTDDNYPPDVQIEIDRLTNALTAIETKIATTEQNMDEARLAQTQRTTEAGRSFRVIDEPTRPSAPESTVMKRIMLVLSFLLLGVVVAIAALLVTTVLDQSIASAADLLPLAGVGLVATVPRLKQLRHAKQAASRRAEVKASKAA